MVVLVRVSDRVGPREAECPTEQLDVFSLPGEKQPSRPHAVGGGICLQSFGRVMLRIQRDRVHDDIPPDAVSKQFLHAHEVGRREWTHDLAARVEDIQGHDLVFDEVVIEADLLAFVSGENEIGEVAFPDRLAR